MPTQAKVDRVKELQEKLERSSIAVTATYTGIGVNAMTDLRRRMREAGVELLVIKNTLMYLAAEGAQRPQVKDIVQGPTAIAFGYGDPTEAARSMHEYIRATRSPLTIQGAAMADGLILQPRDVERLATLPPRDQLLSMLLGTMQAPIQRLLSVLNGPVQSLGGLLYARIQQLEEAEAGA